MLFQELKLKIGEKATCFAGFPRKVFIEIECIKDFGNTIPWSKEWDYIINNPFFFIKVTKGSSLTSHFISQNWNKKK